MPAIRPSNDAPTASEAARAKATLLGLVLCVTGLITIAVSGRPIAWGIGVALTMVGLGLIFLLGRPQLVLERELGQPGMLTLRTDDETRPIRAERITDVRAVRVGAPAGGDAEHAWVTQIEIDTRERLTVQQAGPVARAEAEAIADKIARLKA
ncbi:hypothetical protein [Cupriavidus sp. TMH.W2]|uniref:hypothetical protein n=1 Tax=Cupriavidus sp. TMH.W2 TaxID=3434465 RepID=UPI003D782EF0